MPRESPPGPSARVLVALAILCFVALGPVVAENTAQPASRYALTAAVFERHTINLDAFGETLGVDRAMYRGHLRSDKAPGQSFYAVPFYAVAQVFGAESNAHMRIDGNLNIWWLTFWSALVPFVVLLMLMIRLCARHGLSQALVAGVSLAVGTMLLPYSVNLFGHVLAAVLAFGAWFILDREPNSAGSLAGAGALAAAAVAVEYDVGIILIVLAAYAAYRARGRVLWFVAGTVVPFALLGWYQDRAFGAFWHTPSTYYAGTLNGTTEGGYSIPTFADLTSLLFGGRGLLIGAPIALVGLAAAAWLARTTTGALRRHAIVALAVFVPYLVLVAGWSGTALLEDPGPRYLIPALPFLAVPLAAVWARVRSVGIVATAFGAVIAVSATFTFLLLPAGANVLSGLIDNLRDRHFVDTLWSMALGPLGVVLYVATVAASAVFLVDALRRDAAERTDLVAVD